MLVQGRTVPRLRKAVQTFLQAVRPTLTQGTDLGLPRLGNRAQGQQECKGRGQRGRGARRRDTGNLDPIPKVV